MIKLMIHFFYHLWYDVPSTLADSSENSTSSNPQAEIVHDQFPTLKNKPEVEEAITSTPGLVFAMLKRKCDGRTVKEETKFQCAVCHQSKDDGMPAVLKICRGCKSTPQLANRTRR
jgi:hypothetical protein